MISTVMKNTMSSSTISASKTIEWSRKSRDYKIVEKKSMREANPPTEKNN